VGRCRSKTAVLVSLTFSIVKVRGCAAHGRRTREGCSGPLTRAAAPARRVRTQADADAKVGALEMGANGGAVGPDGVKHPAAGPDAAKFGAHHDHMPGGYHAPHEDMRMTDTVYMPGVGHK
jgi:hypothetical protein